MSCVHLVVDGPVSGTESVSGRCSCLLLVFCHVVLNKFDSNYMTWIHHCCECLRYVYQGCDAM